MDGPIIRIKDIAWMRLQSPDLDLQERYLQTFGLVRAERTANALYMRGTDPVHHIHITHKGEPAVLGIAFWSHTLDDLEKLAREGDGASRVEDLDEPGGGKRVRLTEINGMNIEVVWGVEVARELPVEPLALNFGYIKRARPGRLLRVDHRPARVKRIGHVVISTPDVDRSVAWAKDNDLMETEAKHLGLIKDQIKVLSKTPEGQKVATSLALRLPILMQSIRLSEPSNQKRKVVNIFLKLPGQESGWFTLEQIRNQYPSGVNTRIMVFIWNRILEGLTLSHYSGIVHGAITPNHVLIQAANHSGNIIDWTSSCRTKEGDKVPYVDLRYQAFFPPEVLVQNQSPTFSADIYMSALSMVYILGGDPEKMIIPSNVEGPIRDFINRCLQPRISRRPKDAQVAWGEFRQVAKEVFGRREFVQLVMPTV